MRWIDGEHGLVRIRVRPHAYGFALSVLLVLIVLWTLPPLAQQPSAQRLSVYAPGVDFSVLVQSYNGRDYLGVLDILDRLGMVSAKAENRKWKLRFNDVDAEFEEGKDETKIDGKSLQLASPFHLQAGRGLIPLSSAVPVLSRFLRQPLELHESARRMFIRGVAIRFTAQMAQAPAGAVVLNFSAPVNPSIATEPGKLRMSFSREPLLHTGPQVINLGDKFISALNYQEANGAAEITLDSTAPLLARFSADRKTIIVGPVARIVAQSAPPALAPAPPPTPDVNAPAAVSAQPPPPAAPAPPPLVVVDASHGGTERGAALSDTLAEKDVVLGIALRLHHDLEARGLLTTLLRNSDTALTLDQRAILTNTSRAVYYISIHAGTLGKGVRLYTALLPPVPSPSGPFLPWNTAQAPFLSASHGLAAAIASELGKANLPAPQLSAALPPLNHIAAAAVAVEVNPETGDVSQLNSPAYQEQVAGALAAGIQDARHPGAKP